MMYHATGRISLKYLTNVLALFGVNNNWNVPDMIFASNVPNDPALFKSL